MTAPYPIEEMRKFIIENFPHNDNMSHPDYKAGTLMSAILRWWDDEEKPMIKRLQEENESQKTDYILMNKRYEEYIGGPGEDVKLLKEQLDRWQQTAIEERADYIAAMHVLTGMVPIRSIPATVATVEDHVAGFRERAAKELGLQIEQEASYVKRLEEKISDFYECDATRRGCCRQVAQDQARAALVKIREGKE